MRFILDTSSITSAARSETGASRQIVNAALRKEFRLLLSSQLALEYEDVLLRPEQLAASGWAAAQVEGFILSLLEIAERVDLGPYTEPGSTDPDDNHVLSLAFYGKADAIVTHNLRHFLEPCKLLGVSLYTPAEALRFIRSHDGRRNPN